MASINQKGFPAFSEPQLESLELILNTPGVVDITADAIADTLEAAPPADLARIQASVSGYREAMTVPHLLAPSGSFTGTAGQFTLGTALNSVPVGPVNVYLPAGAGGQPAGWYSATFSSTANGVLSGAPVTTATAWTAGTGIIGLPAFTIPANAVKVGDAVRILALIENNTSATTKAFRCGIGAAGAGINTGLFTQNASTVTANRLDAGFAALSQNRQMTLGGVAAGQGFSNVFFTVATAVAFDLTLSAQCTAATDWAMYNYCMVSVQPA